MSRKYAFAAKEVMTPREKKKLSLKHEPMSSKRSTGEGTYNIDSSLSKSDNNSKMDDDEGEACRCLLMVQVWGAASAQAALGHHSSFTSNVSPGVSMTDPIRRNRGRNVAKASGGRTSGMGSTR
jgi:hypothetical protein